MIAYQNWEVLASALFYFGVKIFCFATKMHRHRMLTSIPERNETEEEPDKKWVPKKKHEVLKAKYKCLKKLFQIYDATVIGILPEQDTDYQYPDDTTPKRRQKRSHRTKTDACAGTSELSSIGDITQSECDKSIATAVIRELMISCSTQFETNSNTKFPNAQSDGAKCENISDNSEFQALEQKPVNSDSKFENQAKLESSDPKSFHADSNQIFNAEAHPVPYLVLNEQRKLTRFQCFVQRVLGIRRDTYVPPFASASDSLRERRRRRGFRFRKIRRTKKTKSESDLNEMRSPAILSCVQSAQRSCLMDTTPRQCPISGCSMMSYGIINYNDHLNLCHFKDCKYICNYCHAGFKRETDKFEHENEHIGINKLNTYSNLSTDRCKVASSSNTQTEPAKEDEKLKKIVSFFDKISNPGDIIEQIKNNRTDELVAGYNSSVSNSDITHCNDRNHEMYSTHDSERTFVYINATRVPSSVTGSSKTTKHLPCDLCGKHIIRCRSQRSLPPNLETPLQDKVKARDFPRSLRGGELSRDTRDLVSHDGRLNVLSIVSAKEETPYSTSTTPSLYEETLTAGKSSESLTCDPTTNIVYSSTSMESERKPSMVESFVKKVMSYRWEPETKIIRV